MKQMKRRKKIINMSKMIYPSDGIYNYCSHSVESCRSNLQNAIINSMFDIPDDFSYRLYLNRLSDTLRNYQREINDIGLKIRNTSNKYEQLSNYLEDGVKRMDSPKIIERDRMIV